MSSSTSPLTVTPPPAPDISSLYGDKGGPVTPLSAPPVSAPALTKPATVEPSMSAAPAPSVTDRVWNAIKEGIPAFNDKFEAASHTDTGTLANGERPEMQLITPQAGMTAAERKAHPIATGIAETAGGLTSPGSVATITATGGFGELPGAAKALIPKLVSLKFSYDAIKGAYDQLPAFKAAMDRGDASEAERVITHVVLDTAMAAAAGQHGVEGARAEVEGAGVPDEASTLKIPKSEPAAEPTLTTPEKIDLSSVGGVSAERPAPKPVAPGKIDLSSVGGAPVDRPAPEIKADGPDWDRTHTAVIDGRKVGSVGMRVDPQGRAQIYGSVVNPDLRGQGIGQKLYKSAIEDAKAQGADRITSDSTNTSPDANRVWEKLRDSGEPVEEITHPNGKPGYQVTFNKPTVDLSDLGGTEAGETPDHLLTSERQSELPEPYSVMVGTEDGMGREEHVDAFSHKDALKQAQKQFPDAREWSVHQIGQRTPSTEYSIPSGKLLSMPEMNSGKTPESTMNHEIGHAMIGQKEGLTQEGILRHTHPDISDGSARASVRWPGADLFDRVTRTIKPEKRTSVVNMMMGGIAADEVFNDTPRAANNNFDYDRHGSDARQAYDILKEAGFKHEEILDVLHKSIDANKEYLQRPEVSGIVKENAGVREPKLSKQFHMSSERLTQMHAEAQRRMGNEISDNGTTGGSNAQNGEANVASGKGTVSGADGEVGPTQEVKPYHPDLQKVADKYGVSDDPAGVKNGASFIAPDGKFIHLGTTEHPDAIRWAGAGNREDFLDQTGAVRVRFNARDKAGPTTHISVPPQGVTEAEIPAIRQAIAQAGRNGNVVMERSDITPETRDTLSMSQDFPRASDTEDYLRKIQAHPDQHLKTHEIIKDDEGDSSFKFGANTESEASQPAKSATEDWVDRYKLPRDERGRAQLFHATPTENAAEIEKTGLKKGSKLTDSVEDAKHFASRDRDLPNGQRMGPEHTTGYEVHLPLDSFHGSGPFAVLDRDVTPEEVSLKKSANAESENEAAASAQRYNAAKGQPEINHEAPPVNDARAKALAAEMDTHSHEPNTPEVKKSYKSLIADVKEQWNHAQKDLGIKFEPSEKDPYDSYEDVKKDVEENKRMKIYTGGNPLPEDHPLAKVDPKTGLTYNTMLRGVHDLYGHIAGNNDFSEQGESGATNAHRQMMSPESVPALLNETEGQVSQYFHGKDKGNFPPQNATTVPEHFVQDWHETAGQMAAKDQAGGIDPKTGASDKKGIGTEIMPELRQPLDHAPTAEDFKSFYEQHKDIFDKYPEIRVGWDNKSNVPGGHEINVGAVGPEGVRVAKKLDQAGSFDIAKGEVIPTGGTGLRTEFPNYSIDERIKDLRGEPLSDVKNFEHLSKDFYDHMEPDERKYLEGNKTLQRNAMAQYHSITPSVNETTNAMQAGAALGGWWQRYIDTFHDLTGGKATQQIGPSHSEVLKQWHAAVSGNKSVQDANNLAWHSYADWLDAGKPTDRTSINNIVKQNAAQPEGSAKKGNAAISDTLTKSGKIKFEGLDTSKLFALVNSPEMRGERPFSNEAFNEETPNALVAKREGARKIPSMGATVAGKGNLNRLVIDAHIRDFYGHKNSGGPAAQYIADSVHLRQAAEALGLKGGEGQEQLWGTVLGLKTLLKEGLTPADAAGKLDAGVINSVGKDYAEVIANDPEIKPLLARLYRDHGIKPGKSDGAGAPNQPTPSTGPAPEGQSGGGKTPIDQASLEKTAGRIREAISDSKIKKSATKPESKGWLAMMSKSGPNAK